MNTHFGLGVGFLWLFFFYLLFGFFWLLVGWFFVIVVYKIVNFYNLKKKDGLYVIILSLSYIFIFLHAVDVKSF